MRASACWTDLGILQSLYADDCMYLHFEEIMKHSHSLPNPTNVSLNASYSNGRPGVQVLNTITAMFIIPQSTTPFLLTSDHISSVLTCYIICHIFLIYCLFSRKYILNILFDYLCCTLNISKMERIIHEINSLWMTNCRKQRNLKDIFNNFQILSQQPS